MQVPASGRLYLAISAKPSPDWRVPHGRNTSHLLGGYKLWLNGVPLGTGTDPPLPPSRLLL